MGEKSARGPQRRDRDNAIVGLADRAEVLSIHMRGGRTVLFIADIIEHQRPAAMGRGSRIALQQLKPPRGERLCAPSGLGEKVLQSLHLGVLGLHHRFHSSQRGERLVEITRGEQSAQVVTKTATLAERGEDQANSTANSSSGPGAGGQG